MPTPIGEVTGATGDDGRTHDATTRRLRVAWEAGDLPALHVVIAASASIWVDRGTPAAFPEPGRGVDEVVRRLLRLRPSGSPLLLTEQSVNGRTGIVCRRGPSVVAILSLEVRDRDVHRIWVVRNPEKLRAWNAEP